MCDWETEVKMLTSEIEDRQAELDECKADLEYALIMRDNAMTEEES